MAKETQKWAGSEVVRIWKDQRKRLLTVLEKTSKKENRPVSETELVSKAVDMYCDKLEPKLGIGTRKSIALVQGKNGLVPTYIK